MTINLTLDLNDCNIISSYKILENSGRADKSSALAEPSPGKPGGARRSQCA